MRTLPSRRTLILAGAALYVAQLIGCPAVSTAVGIVQLVTYTGYNRTALSEDIQMRGGSMLAGSLIFGGVLLALYIAVVALTVPPDPRPSRPTVPPVPSRPPEDTATGKPEPPPLRDWRP